MTPADFATPANGPLFAFLPGLGCSEVAILLAVAGVPVALVLVLARSNTFEEVVAHLPTRLSEELVGGKVEEVLDELGRVRVDARGGIRVEPRSEDLSPLTDVEMDGRLRQVADGYEVTVRYVCKPSAVSWVIAAVLFVTTCVGAVLLLYLVPFSARQKTGKRVRYALDDLEDAFVKRA